MPYQEPEFLPWDGRRVPITYLAGYLGAGKTTLINELLATADRPIAALVNDVGEVNIDARLVRRRHGDTIELTDGCICCSLSDGFGAAIDELRARAEPPDHVVVELSGVADPSRVLPWARSAGFKLDGVLTLVDVDQFEARMESSNSAAIMRTQIEHADVLILTKLDLVAVETRTAVEQRLAAMCPTAPIIAADTAVAASMLRLGGRRPGGVIDLPEPVLFDRHTTTRHELSIPVELRDLERLLEELPADVVRAKAIAVDGVGVRWLVQVVGSRRSITELPAAEHEDPTDLVVISLPTDQRS